MSATGTFHALAAPGCAPVTRRWLVPPAMLLLLVVSAGAGVAQGQEVQTRQVRAPVSDFEQLPHVVQPGAVVVLTTGDGQVVGELLRVEPDALEVKTRGQVRSFSTTDVTRVRLRNRASRFATLGMIAGCSAGLVTAAVYTATVAPDVPNREDSILAAWTLLPLYTCIGGMGTGWFLGTLVPGMTLYLAPSVGGSDQSADATGTGSGDGRRDGRRLGAAVLLRGRF